ncbi:MAG: hypothetical protein KGL39_43975 [Patescibacteria group bacterium]|nr:hypothetical protein [Patescibacteria group bacterium]
MQYALALFLLLFGFVGTVQAQPTCLITDPAWSTGYVSPPSAIQQIVYQISNGYLVAIYPPGNVLRAWKGVPRGVAQQLTSMTNPTTYFNTNIAPVYSESLLSEFGPSGPCPILNEDGAWLLTH